MATSKISAHAGSAQRQWIEKVQERLRVTSDALGNMKAIKLLGLTNVLAEIITRLRLEEVHTSKKFRKILVATLLLCKSTTNPIRQHLFNIASSRSNEPCSYCNLCALRCYISVLEGRNSPDVPSLHSHRLDLPAYYTSDCFHSSLACGILMQGKF
jgi:hypothetical protein